MKPIWKDILFSAFMGLILPGILLNFAAALMQQREYSPLHEESSLAQSASGTSVVMPMLLRKESGSLMEMDMDTYLVGVLLAEMPAYFEPEALKAQGVVARTYARKAYETGGKHGDGSVCVSPACCQGYISEEDYLASGGSGEDVEKIRGAVSATSGQVLTFGGELIEATYFSCSGGRTEDAAAVWGRDFPYLQSVDSPGEENAAHFTDTQVFSPGEFAAALGISGSGDPSSWVGLATYTEGGGVNTMVIGEKTFTGTELRSLLGLRSTAFFITIEEQEISISTKGYGHRVGMSQFGADAMAVAGSSYQEILSHYYGGTELIQLSEH